MKTLLTKALGLFLLIALSGYSLSAQPCPNGAEAFFDFHLNRVKARINAGGSLFGDGPYVPDPQAGVDNPSTISLANLWVGGIDPGGNIMLFTYDYDRAAPAGPVEIVDGLPVPADCGNWDRLFFVEGEDIAAFLEDLPDLAGNPELAVAEYPSIMGWPGSGNPHFFAVYGFDLPQPGPQPLAPFFDKNGNNLYDPLLGEFPAIMLEDGKPFVPAGILWNVFNSLWIGPPLTSNLEIQLTTWAVNCPDQPLLNRTLFTTHQVINRGIEPLDSLFLGIWADFNIGCFMDDYVGSAPELDAFFAYNRDTLDGEPGSSCLGVTPFPNLPPVQSVTFLNRDMSRFMYYNNNSFNNPFPGMTDPVIDWELYRYLTGSWRDGTPLLYGGDGHFNTQGGPTDFAFPDDPSDSQGWSMCSAGLSDYDRKIVGSHKTGGLLIGAMDRLTAAWTFHPDPELPCGLGDMYDEIAALHAVYESGFQGVCAPYSGVDDQPVSLFKLFPNPASSFVTVDPGGLEMEELAVFRSDGSVVYRKDQAIAGPVQLDIAGWHPGVYFVRIKTSSGVGSMKLVVPGNK
jgi:hypothetical protein